MGEKNLWSKVGLIAVIVGLCVWELGWRPATPFDWDPLARLKPGIDLGGGHSLLFEVDDSDLSGEQKRDLAARVMTILKQRVDPQGSRNLIWRPIGWNRIEIQMPRPPKGQKEYRDTYEAARDAITATNITEAQIRSALALPVEARQAEFERLAGPVKARLEMFRKLADAHDKIAALPAPSTQAVDPALAREVDEALRTRRSTMRELLATNLDVRLIADTLDLDRKSPVRATQIAKIKTTHPDLVPQIDALQTAYEQYAQHKGTLDDPSDLMRLLRGAGELEFRILAQPDPNAPTRLAASNPALREEIQTYIDQLSQSGPRPRPNANFAWFEIDKPEESGINERTAIVKEYLGRKYVLAHNTDDMALLNHGDNKWTLVGAYPNRDQQGRPSVTFEFDKRGGDIFAELTRSNLKRPLGIFLDNKAMSAPTIQSEISTRGEITGNFSVAEVQYLVNTLDAGVLPARLKETPLQETSVGPSLGDANRADGIRAITTALFIVVAFMIAYYMYCGLIADIALLLNLVITLGVMTLLQATFTLPGIAGLVLTLGMAVDANVLIYERIREELGRGVSVRMAVKLGYEKAFSAILDSNVTTIITAVILGSLGSEEIKGFGVTLGIGLATSMFTALFVTRQFFHIMVPSSLMGEETRKAWLSTALLAIIGGSLMGFGWLLHQSPAARAESTAFGFGQFLLVLCVTALALLICLWVFRYAYQGLGHHKTNRLPMLKLLSQPNINWMSKYKIYWTVSTVIILGGFFFESLVDPDDYLDIEFLGGTAVQVEVSDAQQDAFRERGDAKLKEYIGASGKPAPDGHVTAVSWLEKAARDIQQNAQLTSPGPNRYLLSMPGYTGAQLQSLVQPVLKDIVQRGGLNPQEDELLITIPENKATNEGLTGVAQLMERLRGQQGAGQYALKAATRLTDARVQRVGDMEADSRPAFEIVTTETEKELVAEAVLAAVGDIIRVSLPIENTLVKQSERAPDGLFPVRMTDNILSEVIGGESQISIADFKGGLALVFDQLDPMPTVAEIEERLDIMLLQPEFEEIGARRNKVVGLDPVPGAPGEPPRFKRIAILVVDPVSPYIEGESNEDWRNQLAEPQLTLAQAALARESALSRVTKFEAQVAGEAVQKAVIAIILSMIAIAAYLWIRFGSIEFGLAGIIALYHDVAVTLTAIMLCHHIHDTAIGHLLMLDDFRIDLSMIAAFLTIVGYSINDTIVIFDRIRENRGRAAFISSRLINDSLNQTLSRTIITTLTTFLTVLAMYVAGGEGIHGFAFAMIIGMISGTYSTLAIATPMLRHPRAMWVATIAIVSMTALLIVENLAIPRAAKIILLALVIGGAVAGAIRQWRVASPISDTAEPATAT